MIQTQVDLFPPALVSRSTYVSVFQRFLLSCFSWTFCLLHSYCSKFPERWWVGLDEDICVYHSLSHSAQCLDLCTCSHPLQEEVSLELAEWGNDLCVWRNIIRSQFILIYYWVKPVIFHFTLGLWAILYLVPGHPCSARYCFLCMVHALSQIRH